MSRTRNTIPANNVEEGRCVLDMDLLCGVKMTEQLVITTMDMDRESLSDEFSNEIALPNKLTLVRKVRKGSRV